MKKRLNVKLQQKVVLEAIDDRGDLLRPLRATQTAVVVEVYPDGSFRTERREGGGSKDWSPDGYRYLLYQGTMTPYGGWRVRSQ